MALETEHKQLDRADRCAWHRSGVADPRARVSSSPSDRGDDPAPAR
jgi:hypothetical protein